MSRAGLSVQSLSVLYELINVLSLYLVQGRAQHFQNIRLFAFFAMAFHPRLRYLAVAWVARFGLRSHVMFFFCFLGFRTESLLRLNSPYNTGSQTEGRSGWERGEDDQRGNME